MLKSPKLTHCYSFASVYDLYSVAGGDHEAPAAAGGAGPPPVPAPRPSLAPRQAADQELCGRGGGRGQAEAGVAPRLVPPHQDSTPSCCQGHPSQQILHCAGGGGSRVGNRTTSEI